MTPFSSYTPITDFSTSLFTTDFASFGILAIIVSVFLFGEYAVVAAVMLTKEDLFSIEAVVLASTIGTLLADCFWFGMGKYFPQRAIPLSLQKKLFIPASRSLHRLIRGRNTLVLFLLRFLIGARLIIILHLARTITWNRFFISNAIGTIFYLLILTIVGLQLADFTAVLTPAYKTITSILSGILLLFLLSKIVEQVLIKPKNNL